MMNLTKIAALALATLTVAVSAAQTSKLTLAGAESVRGQSINNGGDVAVNFTKGGKAGAAVIAKNGRVEAFEALQPFGFELRSINESGTALGVYTDVLGTPHAFVAKNNKLTMVGDSNWGWVDPIQVTNSGIVIGTAHDNKAGFPFIWKNGSWTAIRIEGAAHAYPAAVANDGTVLVKATYASGGKRSFIYDDGKLTEITFGGSDFQVIKMNNKGQVLAYVYGDTTQSVLWDNGIVTEIVVAGAVNVYGWDMNDNGSVVGVAFDESWNSAGFVFKGGKAALLNWSIEGNATRQIDLGVAISNNDQVIGANWDEKSHYVLRKLK